MGSVGKAFGSIAGSILGVKKPKLPGVSAPPGFEEEAATQEIDEASRQALASQAQRRNIANSTNRSTAGTGDPGAQEDLLANVGISSVQLEEQAGNKAEQITAAQEAERRKREEEARRRTAFAFSRGPSSQRSAFR